MSFASVYPLYLQKAQKKGRTKSEVDAVIFWLTGYDEPMLQQQIANKVDFETFSPRRHKSIPMLQKSRVSFAGIGWRKSRIR
jgi:hypothetical protein